MSKLRDALERKLHIVSAAKQPDKTAEPDPRAVESRPIDDIGFFDYLDALSIMTGGNINVDFDKRFNCADDFLRLLEYEVKLDKEVSIYQSGLPQVKYLTYGQGMYPAVLALCCQGTEDTDIGKRIVDKQRIQNRRLYSVLTPDVEENLQRIRKILYYASLMLDLEEHQLFLLSIGKYDRALRIANEFDAGRLTYEEAAELLDEIFD